MSRTVLVTGAAGFIGSHLVDRLLRDGHRVVALDDLSTGRRASLDDAIARGVTLVEADLARTDLDSVVAAGTVDFVVHLAVRPSLRSTAWVPSDEDASTEELTRIRLVSAAERLGVRKLVFAASGGFDGSAAHLCDLPWTSVAFSNVYGPRAEYSGAGGVVAAFAKAMLCRGPCIIYGDGSQHRDLLYVDDAVDALVHALDGPEGRCLQVRTGTELTVNELFREMARLTGYPHRPVHAPPRAEALHAAGEPSPELLALGWRPRTDLRDGLRATLDWTARRLADDRPGAVVRQ